MSLTMILPLECYQRGVYGLLRLVNDKESVLVAVGFWYCHVTAGIPGGF